MDIESLNKIFAVWCQSHICKNELAKLEFTLTEFADKYSGTYYRLEIVHV